MLNLEGSINRARLQWEESERHRKRNDAIINQMHRNLWDGFYSAFNRMYASTEIVRKKLK